MDKLEAWDILIVTSLIGLNVMQSTSTVPPGHSLKMDVEVDCLALGGGDLAGSAGTTSMQVLNAVAQFERDLLIEWTLSGLKRAKSEDKTIDRPSLLSDKQKQVVLEELAAGMSVSAIAAGSRVIRFWQNLITSL